MASPGLTMRVSDTEAPVQIEGTVDGVPFYFRARWDIWEFGAGEDPVDVVVDQGTSGGFYRSGKYDPVADGFGASYMDTCIAEQIVVQCADQWRHARIGRQ